MNKNHSLLTNEDIIKILNHRYVSYMLLGTYNLLETKELNVKMKAIQSCVSILMEANELI